MMPCRAATKPSAQHKAAPAPQATPRVVACFDGEGVTFVITAKEKYSLGDGAQSTNPWSWASPNAKSRIVPLHQAARSLPLEPHAGAARKPLGNDQRAERQGDCQNYQPGRSYFAAGDLQQRIDGGGDRLRLARNVRHKSNGGAEFAECPGKRHNGAGDDAGQCQRQ